MSGTNYSDNPYAPLSGLPSQEPGLFGVSPSTWSNIAAAGAGIINGANQRTASGHLANGTGLAGGIAGGVQGYLGNLQQQAQLRSQLGYQGARTQELGAQTKKLGLETRLQEATLPYQLAVAAQNADFAQNPQHARDWLNNFSQQNGGDQSAPNPFSSGAFTQPAASPYAAATNAKEGTGKNPNSTSQGYGQFNDATWGDFAKANPQFFQGMTPQQISDARNNPKLGEVATQWNARRNAPILAANGAEPNGPNLGLAHFLGPKAAAAVVTAPAGTPVSNVLVNTIGPEFTQQYIQANPQLGALTVDGLRRQYAGIPSPGQVAPWALGQTSALSNKADALQFAHKLGLNIPGDEQYNRQLGLLYAKTGLEPLQAGATKLAELPANVEQHRQQAAIDVAAAGPKAAAEAAGKFPYSTERVAPGGVLAVGGKPAFAVPQRSEEVITDGPLAGTKGQVYRDPLTGQQVGTGVGGAGEGGLPAGFLPTHLSPSQEGFIASLPKITEHFVTQDGKQIDEDLAHVIDSVGPTKQRLFQLRELNPDADTGSQGELRADLKNLVQTYAPKLAESFNLDATPAQEFKKIALAGAGQQERGDLGARGGFRAIELYARANPNLDNTPRANHDVANALLIWNQYHEDYARGATDFYNGQVDKIQKNKSAEGYQRLSKYDPAFIEKFRPELYSSAIGALNGKPSKEWAKGLTPAQAKIVGGILQRTDPSATIDLDGHQIPVSAFKGTIAPQDVTVGGN